MSIGGIMASFCMWDNDTMLLETTGDAFALGREWTNPQGATVLGELASLQRREYSELGSRIGAPSWNISRYRRW